MWDSRICDCKFSICLLQYLSEDRVETVFERDDTSRSFSYAMENTIKIISVKIVLLPCQDFTHISDWGHAGELMSSFAKYRSYVATITCQSWK